MKGKILAAALLALLLSGCRQLPQAREMEDMALMRTVGVDAGRDGQVTVTASSGRRARGIQGETESPLILSAQRGSIAGACLAIQGLSESYVFYGHVDQLLLGEELARDGLRAALEYFERDKELSPGSQVWLIRGDTARAAIESGKEQGIDARLSGLQEDSELGTAGLCPTVGETLGRLLEDGGAYLPALTLEEREGASTPLVERGYGIFRGEKLAGWLTGETARGLELAEGEPGADLLELEGAQVRIVESALRCGLQMKDGMLSGLELNLSVTGEVQGGEETDRDGALRAQVEKRCRRRLQMLVEQLQAWNTDCLGLVRAGGLWRPWDWPAVDGQRGEAFSELDVDVLCSATLY